jgi:alkylation response protein AidB-like acyl-CoA dehydrogenase
MQTMSQSLTLNGASLDALSVDPAISPVRDVINRELAPKVQDIDLKGEFPGQIMHQLGAVGAFSHAVSPEYQGSGKGLRVAIQAIEEISKDCLSTGFIAWCQVACSWYLQNTENVDLKEDLLPPVATGQVLAGTGLSNPMKHFANIEKIALTATRVTGGYVINWHAPLGV